MGLFLGIDGGGTKTECAIGDAVAILGRFATGTCKLQRVGKEAATNSLRAVVQGALYAARCEATDVEFSCVGMAGSSHPEVHQWLEETMKALVPGKLEIVGDNIIAHEAAFQGGPGVIVIAGTGSIAYGRNERGETARAGGWGPVISDEGSGDWVGRMSTAGAMRSFDTGQNTLLIGRIVSAWGVATREDIVRKVNSFPTPDFAALFPEVLAASDAGDGLAREVLTRAGTELAALARIVIRRLWPGEAAIRVAGAGGVLRNSMLVRQVMHNSIRAERKDLKYEESAVDPILGALYLARSLQREGKATE